MSDAAAAKGIAKRRPKYLNIVELGLSQPVPAVLSILHRISGALLFVAMVWLLWMLDRSLHSEVAFNKLREYAALWPVKLSLLVLIWAYCHHFCAGIRYLLLDLHIGIDKATARASSWVVFAASLALTAFLGWKLW
jgi:succinate dehydrogenase / fumarate reductase cytochrome b subunit